MEAKKLVIDITKKRIFITANDDVLSGIQKMDISIDASKVNNPVTVAVRYWRKKNSDNPMELENIKTDMSSCFGVYSVPFDANNYELVQDVVGITEDPLGEYDD